MEENRKRNRDGVSAKKAAAQSIRNNFDCAKGENASKVKWYITELKKYTSITEQGIIVMLLTSGLKDRRSIFSQYMPELNRKWREKQEKDARPAEPTV